MSNVNENIPEGWVECSLGETVEILSSKRIFAADYVSSGIPFYRSKETIEKSKGKEISNPLYISHKRFNDIKNNHGSPINGDILLSAVGERAGIPYLVKNESDFYFKDGNLIWLRNFTKKIDSEYLSYFFNSRIGQHKLESQMIGSAQKALTIVGLKGMLLELPPLPEQKAIANILTAFDDKIENLKAQNKTLETTAQTIFKEWFGKYQVGDELPDGWRVGKLNEFISESLGGDYGKETILDDYTEETLCLRGTDLPDMKLGVPEKAPRRYLKRSKLEKCKLINGDIVIEISGGTENQSTGRVAYINEQILNKSELPITCVNFCRILRPNDPENTYFIYSLFEYLYNRKVLFNWENGTTGIKNLNLKALLNGFDLLLPKSNEKIIEFNQFVKSSFVKIQTNNSQVQTLKQTRDTLLPKLMSGALRVEGFKQ